MTHYVGQLVRDPLTGDKGRVIRFSSENEPVAKTEGGRIFVAGRDVRGYRSLAAKYHDGDAKVCNCARCHRLLLGSCHAEERRKAWLRCEEVSSLPELVAYRVLDRPYCFDCADEPPVPIPSEGSSL